MTLDEFQNRALFVPFKIGGREWSGWDCWGLVYRAFNEVDDAPGGPVNSYAPDYDEHVSYSELAGLIEREKSEWRSIEETPRPWDVGLYLVGRHESHVGLVVPGRRMLHCESGVGTVSEPLDNLIWGGSRRVGYFRRN